MTMNDIIITMEMEEKLSKLSIVPQSHPSYYMLHKYWGRKPHNLLDEYISLFTKPGETVLDPFMGSGGVVIESNKLERIAVGVDLNPMACFIADATLLRGIDYDYLRQKFEDIVGSIPEDVIDLTYTTGDDGNDWLIDNAVWEQGQLARIKYYKDTVRVIKDADSTDIERANLADKILEKYETLGYISYPHSKIMDYVKRSGKETIDQLFTKRNLLIAAFVMSGIDKVLDAKTKKILNLVFSSALPNFSSMIPADKNTVTGKSGWQISKFWVPKIHTEKNAVNALRTRLDKTIKGKQEIDTLVTDTKYSIHNSSSEDMGFLDSESIDYVFTDPPYGDSIAYFALSSFWSTWLRQAVDYDNEIIIDPYRDKKEEDYSIRLGKVFKEVYRVLKRNKYMSFTFNNRHVKYWKIVLDAVYSAGFGLVNVKWVDQPIASGTQGLNRKNTLKGDFVYTFKKLSAPDVRVCPSSCINGEEIVLKTMDEFRKKQKYVTTAALYERLIPRIVEEQAYYDSKNKLLDIDKIVAKKFSYERQEDGKFGWSL